MRAPRWLLALALVGCGGASRWSPRTPDAPFRYAPPALGALLPEAPRSVRTARLANGLRVVVAERPEATTVLMRFVNLRGGDDTERDRPGLASLAAEMMAEAVGRCVGAPEVCGSAPQRWGITRTMSFVSGEADPEHVGVFVRHLAAGLRRFDESAATFARSRDRARGEAQERSRQNRLSELLTETVFDDGTLYSTRVRGSAEEIAELRSDRLRRLVETRYVPSSAVLLAVGRVTLDELLAWVEPMLGVWRGPPAAPRPVTPARLREGGDAVVLLASPGRTQAEVVYAIPLRTPDAASRAAAEVLATAMGSTFSSRLQRALRVERGSTYGVSAELAEHGDVSVLVVHTELEESRVAESLRAVRDAFAAVARDGLTADEFVRARTRLQVGWDTQSDTDDGLADRILDAIVDGREALAAPAWIAALPGVTPEGGNAWIQGALRDASPRVFARGDATRLRAALDALDLGPARIITGD